MCIGTYRYTHTYIYKCCDEYMTILVRRDSRLHYTPQNDMT